MGIPMGLQFSITAIGSMVMQSANNGLGSLYASAFTAGARIKMFAMCPFDALATGVATFCSQNYGAGDFQRIRTGYRIGTIIALLYGFASGAFLIFGGRFSCLLFLSASETEILDAAAQYLRQMGYFYWVLGLLNINRIVVQGLGRSGRAIFSGVISAIPIPPVIILASRTSPQRISRQFRNPSPYRNGRKEQHTQWYVPPVLRAWCRP